MLKKKERLSRAAFDHLFATGKRLHTPFVQLIYAASDSPHGSAVVGKKVAKRAVDRNTLRRRMYGILYPYLKRATPPLRVILIAKPGALGVPRKQFALELQSLLARIFDV